MNVFEFDDLARTLARSRRAFLGASLAFALGQTRGATVDAKRQRKHKRKRQTRTCGGGPACSGATICQSDFCFPKGTCQQGTEACVPESGTKCGDDCFCVPSVEGHTVCVESGGFCANFPNTCTSASPKAACSNCATSDDCAPRQACIVVSGCCEGILLPGPLPVGTTICADACTEPDA